MSILATRPSISRNSEDKVSVRFPAKFNESLMCEIAKLPDIVPQFSYLVTRNESLTFAQFADRITSANGERDPKHEQAAGFLRDLQCKLLAAPPAIATEYAQQTISPADH